MVERSVKDNSIMISTVQIKHDLTEYATKYNLSMLEATNKLVSMFPSIMREELSEYPNTTIAWMSLKMSEGTTYDDIIKQLAKTNVCQALTDRLVYEQSNGIKDGIYEHTLVSLTYNSNKIEGSKLSEDATKNLFETGTVFDTTDASFIPHNIEEARGHFVMFNNMLKTLGEPLTLKLIKSFHYDLKCGVFEDIANGYAIGDFKTRPNKVGNIATSTVDSVNTDMCDLLDWYHKSPKDLASILEFHVRYETIHPFQDGNGRTGRLLLFRECLVNDIKPFIVYDEYKGDYIRAMDLFRQTKDLSSFLSLANKLQDLYYKELVSYNIPK